MNARELRDQDGKYVWHPFTPHSAYADDDPLLVVEGDGHYLIDVEGNRYLDGVASLWCSAFGHRRPEIDAAIRAQLDRIAHSTLLGNASVPSIELAKRLVDLTPAHLTRVFFSDDGSTAVEAALKIAYQYQQQNGRPERTKFLALGNAYHGDTVGSVSVGGMDLFHARFKGLLFGVVRAPSPHCYRCPLGLERESCGVACADRFEEIVREHGAELAAVILEPGFQGAAGIVPYPEGFLGRAEAATREAGALFVLDEVAAGMGRSAAMFACEREGLTPDLLCLAKMLTGGYLPLAATLATEELFEGFLGPPEEGRTFFHGHTFTGNALAAAAALATLSILENDRILEQLPARERYLRERLSALSVHPAVGDVRAYGLAAGVELVRDRDTRQAFPASERRGMRVCRRAREKGVFLRPLGDVIVLMPPLTITTPEIDLLVDAVRYGVEKEC